MSDIDKRFAASRIHPLPSRLLRVWSTLQDAPQLKILHVHFPDLAARSPDSLHGWNQLPIDLEGEGPTAEAESGGNPML